MTLEMLRSLKDFAAILKSAGKDLTTTVVGKTRDSTTPGTLWCGLDDWCTVSISQHPGHDVDGHTIRVAGHGGGRGRVRVRGGGFALGS